MFWKVKHWLSFSQVMDPFFEVRFEKVKFWHNFWKNMIFFVILCNFPRILLQDTHSYLTILFISDSIDRWWITFLLWKFNFESFWFFQKLNEFFFTFLWKPLKKTNYLCQNNYILSSDNKILYIWSQLLFLPIAQFLDTNPRLTDQKSA